MSVLSDPQWHPDGIGLKGVEQFAEWLGIDERELEYYEGESKPKRKGVVGGGLPFGFRVLISAKTGVRSSELADASAWDSTSPIQLFTRSGEVFTETTFRKHLQADRQWKRSLRADRGARRMLRVAVDADAKEIADSVSWLLWLAAADRRGIYDLANVSIHESLLDVARGLGLEKKWLRQR